MYSAHTLSTEDNTVYSAHMLSTEDSTVYILHTCYLQKIYNVAPFVYSAEILSTEDSTLNNWITSNWFVVIHHQHHEDVYPFLIITLNFIKVFQEKFLLNRINKLKLW